MKCEDCEYYNTEIEDCTFEDFGCAYAHQEETDYV